MAVEQDVTDSPDYWTLRIVHDDDVENPLEPVGWVTFAGWHRRYRIGNEQPSCDPEEYLKDLVAQHGDDLVILPVYMHDHGGFEYSCGSFGDPWDSGQVGWIWTTPTRWLGDSGQNPPGHEVLCEALRSTVESYSSWANGDAWGYIATPWKYCEHCGESRRLAASEESCWGFLGSDNAARENLRAEVPEQVRHLFDAAWEERA